MIAPPVLAQPRICAVADVRAVCAADQSARVLRGVAFRCQVRASVDSRTPFVGHLSYEGRPLRPTRGTLPAGAWSPYLVVAAGGLRLPGGSWSCEIDVGPTRFRRDFRVAGPTGAAVDAGVCTASTLQRGAAPVCARSERSPLRRAPHVVCSALLPNAVGRILEIRLYANGRPTRLALRERIARPVVPVGAAFTIGKRFPAGRYACRIAVGGVRAATLGFSVR